jgi:hypothetical protein
MWELRHGRAGFRAVHEERPKLYQVALCTDMWGPAEVDDWEAEREEERLANLEMQASEFRNFARAQEKEEEQEEEGGRSGKRACT